METRLGKLREKESDIVFGEDGGESLTVPDLDVTKDAPLRGDAKMIVEEDPQGDLGLIHGGGLVVLLLAEEDEVVADLRLGKGAWIGVEVFAEHTNVRDIGIDGTGSVVTKLDKLAIAI